MRPYSRRRVTGIFLLLPQAGFPGRVGMWEQSGMFDTAAFVTRTLEHNRRVHELIPDEEYLFKVDSGEIPRKSSGDRPHSPSTAYANSPSIRRKIERTPFVLQDARKAIVQSRNLAHTTLVRFAVLGVMIRHQFAACHHNVKLGQEAK